jgi:hypothetical protein
MITGERRSGIDSRSEAEKLRIGERRSGTDRRAEPRTDPPSNEQLALFARRLRRAMRDDKGRSFFGMTNGENDFALYPEVVRVVEWIERQSAEGQQAKEAPSLRRAAPGPKADVPAAES